MTQNQGEVGKLPQPQQVLQQVGDLNMRVQQQLLLMIILREVLQVLKNYSYYQEMHNP